jgi:methionyl-tRNA formyltransferase
MSFKILFMGTPEYAVPSLEMLVREGYDVAACVTQPDRKAGRGHRMTPPPVKELAQKHGIPVFQPERISGPEGEEMVRKLAPSLMVTAAFGHILSDALLGIPEYGCINVHASLLPRYRGAAPVNWAIINGEARTGVTTMYTVRKLDAGDILERDEMEIPAGMTAGELYARLSELGAHTLRRTLEKLANGTLRRVPQDEREASYYPMFGKGFGQIDFSRSCGEIVDFVRGTTPFPGAYVLYGEEKIGVARASRARIDARGGVGETVRADGRDGLLVMARDGVVSLDMVKRPGGRLMPARDSLRGRPMEAGYRFARPAGEYD